MGKKEIVTLALTTALLMTSYSDRVITCTPATASISQP